MKPTKEEMLGFLDNYIVYQDLHTDIEFEWADGMRRAIHDLIENHETVRGNLTILLKENQQLRKQNRPKVSREKIEQYATQIECEKDQWRPISSIMDILCELLREAGVEVGE
jgi:hypothetical protein